MSAYGEQIDLSFGTGHFIGPVYGDREFVDIADDPDNPNLRLQASLAGYANGCPVARELIDSDTGRGPEVMLNRYASVNFWFTYITEMAQERNENLHQQLTTPVPRRTNEPAGKYEPLSVPEDYEDEIPPMGTLYGWALPRLLIKQMGSGTAQEETVRRLDRGLTILEQVMDTTDDPITLLARFAERISQEDVPPTEVLQNILSAGWFEEQNAPSMMNALKAALREHAVASAVLSPDTPTLWDIYTRMSEPERAALGINQRDYPLPPDFIHVFIR